MIQTAVIVDGIFRELASGALASSWLLARCCPPFVDASFSVDALDPLQTTHPTDNYAHSATHHLYIPIHLCNRMIIVDSIRFHSLEPDCKPAQFASRSSLQSSLSTKCHPGSSANVRLLLRSPITISGHLDGNTNLTASSPVTGLHPSAPRVQRLRPGSLPHVRLSLSHLSFSQSSTSRRPNSH